jgi:hypothetical protein
MPLDPVIAQGFRGIELQNPLDAYARVNQLQQAQQQNQLNALKMQEYQRESETTNRLRSLDPNAPNYMSEVTRLNPELGSQLMLRSKQQTAAERAAAASDAEGRAKNLSYWQGIARDSARTPTDEVVGALARRAVELGVTDEATARSQLSEILSMPLERRSQVLSQYGAAAAAAPATPADVAAMQALGFPLTQQGYEQFRAAQRQERMLTPEEERQRIRIAQASRPPAQPRAESPPSITQIQSPTDPTQMITVDARRYNGGGVGSPGVIGASGKTPKAEADKIKQEQGASQAMDVLDTLKTAYSELDRMRAVPSEQRSALSNIAAGTAATGVGQATGRLFGTKEQTQRDVITSSRNQLLMALKNATGMSSQQLNSNVELRVWLDSLSDPSKSIQANQTILDNVERFITSGGKYSALKGENSLSAPAKPGVWGKAVPE